MNLKRFLFLVLISNQTVFAATGILSPDQLLGEVYKKNAELASSQAQVEVEKALVSKSYFLNDPTFGIMKESRAGEKMEFLTVTQEIMFPTKYFSMGAAQKARARAAQSQFELKRLEVRAKTFNLYYGFYSAQRILSLLEAQRETLKEIARIAESRRATGAVPQQDEMKAHVEQTMIENEILMQKQDVADMAAELAAVINQESVDEIILPKEDFKPPQMKFSRDEIYKLSLEKSKVIGVEQAMYDEAVEEKSVAKMTYLPDIMLNYKKGMSDYSFEIGFTIPLWFFTKQTSDVSAASARLFAAEKRLEQEKRNTKSEVRALANKVETFAKLIKIFEGALIPQSASALNSSRAAYTAGRVGFQELLDAERSLYAVRIEYYKNFTKYIEAISMLEKVMGMSLSSLPFEGEGL
jgi:cobalt-zinc-cadmium efflux system outer membrane protein